MTATAAHRPLAPPATLPPRVRSLRLGLLLFVLLLTFDGALRKWAFPGAERLLFVAKDGLCLWLVAQVYSYQRGLVIPLPPAVRQLLALYAFWVVLNAFNPSVPNLLVGIWGMKAHLLYAGLIPVVAYAYPTVESLFRDLERLFPWIVVPVSLLSFAQLGSGAESVLNQQVKGGIEGISTFGEEGLVRVAGSFSYISGMAAFVQVMALLGVGLYLAGARSRPFLIGLAFALMALPVTGSRAVIVNVAVGLALLLLLGWQAGLINTRRFVQACLLLGLLGLVSFLAQDAAWEALQQRAEANREEGIVRILDPLLDPLGKVEVAGWMGYGAGTANLGSVALTASIRAFSWLPYGVTFEGEAGRLMLELGVVGSLLSLALRLSLLWLAGKLAVSGPSGALRAAGVVAFPFLAIGAVSGTGVFAPSYGAVGYWFAAALLAVAYRQARRSTPLPG